MWDPSWRAAVRGRLSDRGEVLAVAAATALLVVTVATEPLVVWTSAQAALERLVGTGEGALRADRTDVVASVPQDAPVITELVRDRLDALSGFDPAVSQLTSISWLVRDGADAVEPVVSVGDRSAPAVLFHRGGAIASLDVVSGPHPAGEVWLPDGLADALGLRPGAALEVGFAPVGAAAERSVTTTVLAGTYATVDGRPSGLLADPGVDLPPAPRNLARPAVLVLAEVDVMARLGEEIGDLQLSTLRASISRPLRYEDLRAGADELAQLQADLVDAESLLGRPIYDRFNGPEVRVDSATRRFVTQAEGTAERVAAQVGGAADAGIALAAATLGATVVAAARRRRRTTRLELVHGSGPLAIGLRATVAAVPAVVVGALAGRLVVLPLAATVLPAARVPDPGVAALTPRALAAGVVAIVVVLAVRSLDAGTRLRVLGRDGTDSELPVVPMLLATAVAVTAGVLLGPARAPTDPFVVALPVVVTAAVAVVILGWGVDALRPDRGGRSEPSARWLARRRLAGQSRRLVGVGALVATAAGIMANAAVLFASGEVAADAKAAALAGAEVVVSVPAPGVVPPGAPADSVTTVVVDNALDARPDGELVRLVAVEPNSFAAVATWPAGTDPSVLDALAAHDGVGLPVLAVDGPSRPSERGSLERTGWWALPYEVVGHVGALPGSDPRRPVLLTTQDALFARLDPGLDPRRGPADPAASDPDGPWSTEVWLDEATAAAAAAAVDVRGVRVVRTLRAIRAQPAFLAGTWSLGVLGGLGGVALLLALLLVAGTRGRPDDEAGLERAVLVRLGVRPAVQRRAAVLERVVLVAVATAIGLVVGTVLAAAIAGSADPEPALAPALAVVVPWDVLAAVGAALVGGGLVAGLLDDRAARRADVEEALRVTS